MAENIILKVDFQGADVTSQKAITLATNINKLGAEKRELAKQVKNLDVNSKTYSQDLKALITRQNEVGAQLKVAKKEFNELERATINATTANRAEAGSIKQLRAELASAQSAYVLLSKAKRQNTKDGKELKKRIDELDATVKGHEQSMGIHNRSVGDYGKALRGLVPSFTAVGAAALAFNVLKDVVKTLEEFELQMAKVKAVTNATEAEFTALVDSAKELGRTSQFTATEVGQLQEEFAKLGFSTPEILAATEATLNLATATQSDLAQSAKVAAATINGFQLTAEDTLKVTDVMAKSFTSTSLDINKFENAMAKVAPAAKSVGVDITQTTAALGVLSDAGLEATTAGTSFRNILLESSKMGLNYRDALDLVKNSTNQSATAVEIFGKENAVAAITLAKNQEQLDQLAKSFSAADGTAAKMAETLGDTSVGASKKLESAWEGLMLSFGDGAEGPLAAAKEGLASFINSVVDLQDESNDLATLLEDDPFQFSRWTLDTEAQSHAIFRVRQETEFLNKNLNNQSALQLRIAQNDAKLKILKSELAKAQKEENDKIEDFATLQIKALENSNEAIQLQLKQAKEQEKLNKKKVKTAEIDEQVASIEVDLKKQTLEQLEKLDTKEAKAEIKRRKEVADEKKRIEKEVADDTKKLSESLLKLRQDTYLTELRDKEKIEDEKLRIEEENAIRSINLTKATEEEKAKAIAATQENFAAKRKALEFKREEEKKKEDEKKQEEERKKAEEADKDPDNPNSTAYAKKQQEAKEEARKELAFKFAEETARGLIERANRRNEEEKQRDIESLQAKLDAGIISQQEFDTQREEIDRKAFKRKKRLDTSEVLVNALVAASKIIAQVGLTPALPFALATLGVQTAAQVAGIQAQTFASGGFTGPGNGTTDHTGHSPVGIVHDNEFVASKRTLSTPLGMGLANMLDGINRNPALGYYAEGGFTTRTLQVDNESIAAALSGQMQQIKVVNVASETAYVDGRTKFVKNKGVI